MPEKIGIIGNGGQADETESYLASGVAFRAVENKYIDDIARVDIASPGEYADYPVVFAIGTPGLRKKLVDIWPGNNYTKVISKISHIDHSVDIREGAIIAPGTFITTNVEIGRHALINVGSSIQHDSKLGDFVTVGPGVRIAGNVNIEDGVFVGIGSTIIQRVNVAPGVVIGAGSVVTRDLDMENGLYVGAPARLVKENGSWLYEL